MTRIEALDLLFAPSAHDRFRAARALEKLATIDDQAVLKRAKHLETDAYVIKRLEHAIQSCSKEVQIVPNELVASEDVHEIIRTQRSAAVEWITGLLLHEIGAKIGLIELFAKGEIPDYSVSKTKRTINNLQEIFEGIAQLKTAASLPQAEEFSLAALLDQIIDFEIAGKEILVSRVGEKPCLVNGDPRLVRLAVCNGIRNGIEAVLSLRGTDEVNLQVTGPAELIVSWGSTDTDYWITVIDHGPGVSDSERFFSVGTSTKDGHLGFGLAIAKQAVESLGGIIQLYASPAGGATYEIRWSKPVERINR